MFFVAEILGRKGPLSVLWLAAHLDKKYLTKDQILSTNVAALAQLLQVEQVKISLRTTSDLILGLCNIHQRKLKYRLEQFAQHFDDLKQWVINTDRRHNKYKRKRSNNYDPPRSMTVIDGDKVPSSFEAIFVAADIDISDLPPLLPTEAEAAQGDELLSHNISIASQRRRVTLQEIPPLVFNNDDYHFHHILKYGDDDFGESRSHKGGDIEDDAIPPPSKRGRFDDDDNGLLHQVEDGDAFTTVRARIGQGYDSSTQPPLDVDDNMAPLPPLPLPPLDVGDDMAPLPPLSLPIVEPPTMIESAQPSIETQRHPTEPNSSIPLGVNIPLLVLEDLPTDAVSTPTTRQRRPRRRRDILLPSDDQNIESIDPSRRPRRRRASPIRPATPQFDDEGNLIIPARIDAHANIRRPRFNIRHDRIFTADDGLVIDVHKQLGDATVRANIRSALPRSQIILPILPPTFNNCNRWQVDDLLTIPIRLLHSTLAHLWPNMDHAVQPGVDRFDQEESVTVKMPIPPVDTSTIQHLPIDADDELLQIPELPSPPPPLPTFDDELIDEPGIAKPTAPSTNNVPPLDDSLPLPRVGGINDIFASGHLHDQFSAISIGDIDRTEIEQHVNTTLYELLESNQSQLSFEKFISPHRRRAKVAGMFAELLDSVSQGRINLKQRATLKRFNTITIVSARRNQWIPSAEI